MTLHRFLILALVMLLLTALSSCGGGSVEVPNQQAQNDDGITDEEEIELEVPKIPGNIEILAPALTITPIGNNQAILTAARTENHGVLIDLCFDRPSHTMTLTDWLFNNMSVDLLDANGVFLIRAFHDFFSLWQIYYIHVYEGTSDQDPENIDRFCAKLPLGELPQIGDISYKFRLTNRDAAGVLQSIEFTYYFD